MAPTKGCRTWATTCTSDLPRIWPCQHRAADPADSRSRRRGPGGRALEAEVGLRGTTGIGQLGQPWAPDDRGRHARRNGGGLRDPAATAHEEADRPSSRTWCAGSSHARQFADATGSTSCSDGATSRSGSEIVPGSAPSPSTWFAMARVMRQSPVSELAILGLEGAADLEAGRTPMAGHLDHRTWREHRARLRAAGRLLRGHRARIPRTLLRWLTPVASQQVYAGTTQSAGVGTRHRRRPTACGCANGWPGSSPLRGHGHVMAPGSSWGQRRLASARMRSSSSRGRATSPMRGWASGSKRHPLGLGRCRRLRHRQWGACRGTYGTCSNSAALRFVASPRRS